jgi:CBS domain-containing protein
MVSTNSDQVICPACGATNIEGADACEDCGTDLQSLGLPASMQREGDTDLNSSLTEIRLNTPHILPASAPVADAVDILRRDPDSAVVVREGADVAGIFTERDIMAKVAGDPQQLALPLSQLMTPDPVILRDADTIAIALNKMVLGGFRHIPLVHDKELVGVVTASDLMQWFMQKYFD